MFLGVVQMSSVRRGFLNNRLFQPASLSRSITSRELRRLKSIKLYCIVIIHQMGPSICAYQGDLGGEWSARPCFSMMAQCYQPQAPQNCTNSILVPCLRLDSEPSRTAASLLLLPPEPDWQPTRSKCMSTASVTIGPHPPVTTAQRVRYEHACCKIQYEQLLNATSWFSTSAGVVFSKSWGLVICTVSFICYLKLDNATIRISVGLHLGPPVCFSPSHPHLRS